jgi:hypothetical protein
LGKYRLSGPVSQPASLQIAKGMPWGELNQEKGADKIHIEIDQAKINQLHC